MKFPFKRPGYALGSGGYAIVYSVGPLLELFAAGITPWYVAGASGGVINGGTIVEHRGDPRPLVPAWKWVEKKGPSFIFNKRERYMNILADIFRDVAVMHSNNGLRELIAQIDFKKVFASHIPFDVFVTNKTTHRREIFSTMDDDMRKHPKLMELAMVASCSLYGVFPVIPITHHGVESLYFDGYCPMVKRAFDLGCDAVFFFSNNVPHKHDTEPSEIIRGLDLNRHFLTCFLEENEKVYAKEHYPGKVFFTDEFYTEGIDTLKGDDFMFGDITRSFDLGREVGRKIVEIFK